MRLRVGVHERHIKVSRAGFAMLQHFQDISAEHDLTPAEELDVLTSMLNATIKSVLQEERKDLQ